MDGSRSCAGLCSELPIVCHMKAPLFPSALRAPQLSSHFCCCGSRGQTWLCVNAALMHTSPDSHLALGSRASILLHPGASPWGRQAALVMAHGVRLAHVSGMEFPMETLARAWHALVLCSALPSVGLQDRGARGESPCCCCLVQNKAAVPGPGVGELFWCKTRTEVPSGSALVLCKRRPAGLGVGVGALGCPAALLARLELSGAGGWGLAGVCVYVHEVLAANLLPSGLFGVLTADLFPWLAESQCGAAGSLGGGEGEQEI